MPGNLQAECGYQNIVRHYRAKILSCFIGPGPGGGHDGVTDYATICKGGPAKTLLGKAWSGFEKLGVSKIDYINFKRALVAI